jgi:hypothetical protein
VAVAIITAATLGFVADSAEAIFVEGPEILPGTSQHHGIVFEGTRWYIANIFSGGLHQYNTAFTSLGDINFPGVAQTRGLTRSPTAGHLIASDYEGGQIFDLNPAAGTSSALFAAFEINAVALDTSDNTLWMVRFDTGGGSGLVEHRQLNGTMLGSFATPTLQLTGIAYDPRSDTLFLMETEDRIFEFTTTGTGLGPVVATDEINGNGQDLYYDPAIGRLYATSQEQPISVFNDPSRVPEPASAVLLLVAAAVSPGFLSRPRYRA